MWATHHGNTDCVRLLVECGADTNASSNVRCTILNNLAYVSNNYDSLIPCKLFKTPTSTKQIFYFTCHFQCGFGKTALYVAVEHGHTECVRILLERETLQKVHFKGNAIL